MSGLSIAKSGTYALVASSKKDGEYKTTYTKLEVTPGAPSKVTFLKQPMGGPKNGADPLVAQLAIMDSKDNIISSDSSTSVDLSLTTNPSAAALTGGAGKPVQNGVVSFTFNVDKAGDGYKFMASTNSGLASATSEGFDITCPMEGVQPCLTGGKSCDCPLDCCSNECEKEKSTDTSKQCVAAV